MSVSHYLAYSGVLGRSCGSTQCHNSMSTSHYLTSSGVHNIICGLMQCHNSMSTSHYLAFFRGGGMSCRSLCPGCFSCAGGCQREWLMTWNRISLVTGCRMLAHTPAQQKPHTGQETVTMLSSNSQGDEFKQQKCYVMGEHRQVADCFQGSRVSHSSQVQRRNHRKKLERFY